jgi:carboxymethylenebutenolidase
MTRNTAGRRIAPGLAALAVAVAVAIPTGRARAEPPEAKAAIEEVDETFPSHGKRVAVERFTPPEAGRYPLIVLLHGVGGIGPPGTGSMLREQARRLARLGYVALIPHYFDRTGTKLDNATRNGRYYKVWTETVADAVTYGIRLPQVDRRKVGLLGFSLGASVAVSTGMADPRVSAVVEYAGSFVGISSRPFQGVPPMLLLHGDADRIVPVREAHKLEALFNEWQARFEIKIYPGAGHGFRGDDEKDAWKRTVEFFDRHVKGA